MFATTESGRCCENFSNRFAEAKVKDGQLQAPQLTPCIRMPVPMRGARVTVLIGSRGEQHQHSAPVAGPWEQPAQLAVSCSPQLVPQCTIFCAMAVGHTMSADVDKEAHWFDVFANCTTSGGYQGRSSQRERHGYTSHYFLTSPLRHNSTRSSSGLR